jgi:hypothetical protein
LQRKAEDNVSPLELRQVCDNVLNLFTTTIPRTHKVLWPYLLETLGKPVYTASTMVVARSIARITCLERDYIYVILDSLHLCILRIVVCCFVVA